MTEEEIRKIVKDMNLTDIFEKYYRRKISYF